ncbi:hypothetical protein MNBD_ACTINO02-1783 [hydrothermal vent metagenome]|uniref:Uncharacterized protein n=1 Tax=hydrothermal vent metagenome TaxID=652676 RepID=A0A3B0SW10_9ZZZZ
MIEARRYGRASIVIVAVAPLDSGGCNQNPWFTTSVSGVVETIVQPRGALDGTNVSPVAVGETFTAVSVNVCVVDVRSRVVAEISTTGSDGGASGAVTAVAEFAAAPAVPAVMATRSTAAAACVKR